MRAAAATYGDAVAITLQGQDGPVEQLSFREVEAQSAELAKGLIARGAGKGSRIGFIAGNGPQFLLMLAAIARIGAIAIPISTLIKANELVRVLRQSDVTGLIVQRHAPELLEPAVRLRIIHPLIVGEHHGDQSRIAGTLHIVLTSQWMQATARFANLARDGGKGNQAADIVRAVNVLAHAHAPQDHGSF